MFERWLTANMTEIRAVKVVEVIVTNFRVQKCSFVKELSQFPCKMSQNRDPCSQRNLARFSKFQRRWSCGMSGQHFYKIWDYGLSNGFSTCRAYTKSQMFFPCTLSETPTKRTRSQNWWRWFRTKFVPRNDFQTRPSDKRWSKILSSRPLFTILDFFFWVQNRNECWL